MNKKIIIIVIPIVLITLFVAYYFIPIDSFAKHSCDKFVEKQRYSIIFGKLESYNSEKADEEKAQDNVRKYALDTGCFFDQANELYLF